MEESCLNVVVFPTSSPKASMSYQRKEFDKDRPLQYPFLRQRMAANYEPLVVLIAAKLRAQYFGPEKGPVLTI